MPEAKTGKGIQISKIAKEVNRQSDEILEYLKRIGIEAGGIMSKVDESVYNKILGHFKTDLEDATKHKQNKCGNEHTFVFCKKYCSYNDDTRHNADKKLIKDTALKNREHNRRNKNPDQKYFN